MSLRHWLQLTLTSGIGPILLRRLIEATGGVQQACSATPKLLASVDGIGRGKADKIARALEAAAGEVDAELAKAESLGVSLVCYADEDYPVALRSIPDPPAVLYVRGTFEPRDLHAVAIVGSRRCSFYGREQAERFAALMAGAGLTVLSGGARGVDSSAHRGALSHPQGRTIAVLGSGVDVPYPPENEKLFEQIALRGAVVSEYPFGTPPIAENFPRRNRIVSGMSRGVLVVEADERSGALITARVAIEDQGRTVFALPGRVDNALSAGPHKLIKEGAVLVRNLEDILNELGPLPHDAMEAADVNLFSDNAMSASLAEPKTPPPTEQLGLPTVGLSEQQLLLLSHLDGSGSTIDQLIDRSGLAAPIVMRELTFLSLRGAVRRVDGQTYALRNPGG